MYKIYTIYKEGAIFGCFPIFVGSGRNYFLTDWTGGSCPGPSVLRIFLWLCCAAVVATTTPSDKYGTQCRTKMGPEFHQLHSLLPKATTQTFVNCMQQKKQTLPLFWNCVCKSYIFTCRLLLFCVLEICCMGWFFVDWFFFGKKMKKWNSCVLKKVSHWKCSEVKISKLLFSYYFFFFFWTFCYLWETLLIVHVRTPTAEKNPVILHASWRSPFNWLCSLVRFSFPLSEKCVNSHQTFPVRWSFASERWCDEDDGELCSEVVFVEWPGTSRLPVRPSVRPSICPRVPAPTIISVGAVTAARRMTRFHTRVERFSSLRSSVFDQRKSRSSANNRSYFPKKRKGGACRRFQPVALSVCR